MYEFYYYFTERSSTFSVKLFPRHFQKLYFYLLENNEFRASVWAVRGAFAMLKISMERSGRITVTYFRKMYLNSFRFI